ncbi:group II truncated hemoglobin [Chromohalobacter sp. TMW 2.2299]|uniref:group II truncated hemoglobin n=2 Tax=Halomonadaceae TaxID=28256 RepID=UPI0021C0C10F|nr:group II truncated hemoglobin [Chromohalobacter canadensis]MCK2044800.1 group II truncated hemoglobin [Chromohalobacter moromii]MCT8467787.1 group II truncated hemoglobin [Chromohalobacter canadensis]MCT8470465.1 group II truncated hemoglobin [Chromohalobacter canadensis]MCT8498284.1 group II truncated hemoglobin [Chromohalobacter canadensis]
MKPCDMSPQARVFGVGDSTLRAVGGESAVRELVERFYAAMVRLPEARGIRALHPDDLGESRDKLTTFLIGWMGGPSRYRERFGPIAIPAAHRHLDIGPEERDAWLTCMATALDEIGAADDLKRYLLTQLRHPAEMCRRRR